MKSFPKIFFGGDVHGDFSAMRRLIQREKPDAVILLGDLEPNRDLLTELKPFLGSTIVRYIHGNHDTDSQEVYQRVFESPCSHWNLHGKVEDICGLRVAGLGGVFRRKVWMPPHEPSFDNYEQFLQCLNDRRPPHQRARVPGSMSAQEREQFSSIFPNEVRHLSTLSADILVVHEAPSCHEYGFDEIDKLARNMGVKVVYHGHHHQHRAYPDAISQLGFHAHGVALRRLVPLHEEELEGKNGGQCAVTSCSNIAVVGV